MRKMPAWGQTRRRKRTSIHVVIRSRFRCNGTQLCWFFVSLRKKHTNEDKPKTAQTLSLTDGAKRDTAMTKKKCTAFLEMMDENHTFCLGSTFGYRTSWSWMAFVRFHEACSTGFGLRLFHFGWLFGGKQTTPLKRTDNTGSKKTMWWMAFAAFVFSWWWWWLNSGHCADLYDGQIGNVWLSICHRPQKAIPLLPLNCFTHSKQRKTRGRMMVWKMMILCEQSTSRVLVVTAEKKRRKKPTTVSFWAIWCIGLIYLLPVKHATNISWKRWSEKTLACWPTLFSLSLAMDTFFQRQGNANETNNSWQRSFVLLFWLDDPWWWMPDDDANCFWYKMGIVMIGLIWWHVIQPETRPLFSLFARQWLSLVLMLIVSWTNRFSIRWRRIWLSEEVLMWATKKVCLILWNGTSFHGLCVFYDWCALDRSVDRKSVV